MSKWRADGVCINLCHSKDFYDIEAGTYEEAEDEIRKKIDEWLKDCPVDFIGELDITIDDLELEETDELIS